MNTDERERILRNENIIWLIYAAFAFFGIHANNLELEDLRNNSDEHRRTFKTINIIIFTIALFIYIYFINITIKNYQKKKSRNNLFVLIGSFLILIAGTLFLLAELNADDETIIPNE